MSIRRWITAAALGLIALASAASWSRADRAVVVGIVVPAICIALMSAFVRPAAAFVVAIPIGIVGPLLAAQRDEANINVLPIVLPFVLLGAAWVGLLIRLAIEGAADGRQARRWPRSGRSPWNVEDIEAELSALHPGPERPRPRWPLSAPSRRAWPPQ